MTGDRDITDICLKLLALESAQQLLEFELDNQKWFEEFIPPRESEFYSLDGVIDHIQHFLLEYKCHQLLPLLICNANGDIMGRLNFTNVDLTKRTAHVGYRVGKAFLSRGVAKTALRKGLIAMAEKGIKRVFAYVDENNPASQKVLLANGFVKVRVVEDYAILRGEPIHCIEYTCQLKKT